MFCHMCFGAHHIHYRLKRGRLEEVCSCCGNVIRELNIPELPRNMSKHKYVKWLNEYSKNEFR